MDENAIFCIDGIDMCIQQKIKVESLLKWLNLILYPSKHGDRHQNYFDTISGVTRGLIRGGKLS